MEDVKEIEKQVDSMSLHKAGITVKKHKRAFKTLGVLIVVLSILAVSATAAYLTYFAQFNATVKVTQSVQVDGQDYSQVFFEYDGELSAGCCDCGVCHTVVNNGCQGIWLDFESTGTPDLEGIDVVVKECGPSCCTHILESLEITSLDGQAQWDSYDVYVDGYYAGTYTAVDDGGIENWVTTIFDITPLEITCCGTHTIKIDCINGPWTYFNPYGQLGIDIISLYCEGHVLCDTVDMGKPASETGHNLIGWGPIEPATTGGNWGGIDDCRATWFYTDGDTVPPSNPPYSTCDESWASVELSCEDCYQSEECTCESPDMTMPFYLEPGESKMFCICYSADMLLEPQTYDIITKLIPATIL